MSDTALPCVCFLTGTLNAFAGAERMTAVIANALAQQGYRVLVLSLWDETSVFPLHPDVRHHALFATRPSFKREYLAAVRGIRRFVREHGVKVLVEVDTMLTLFTVPATVGMQVRRIAWEHCHFDEDLGRRARRVARWVAAKSNDGIVVLTERDKALWKRGVNLRCAVHAIPNPLPFAFPKTGASLDARIVLAVGRLTPAKGFDVLLSAWAHVAPAFPDWQLIIVGEGDARASLEAQIGQLDLSATVSIPGTTNRIEEYYRQASIFCMSSWYEGFSLVLVEAMAFGLPIISTDCDTGPRELISHNFNGLLVPTGDATAVATSLKQMLASRDLRSRLGTQARAGARVFEIRAIERHWSSLMQGLR